VGISPKVEHELPLVIVIFIVFFLPDVRDIVFEIGAEDPS